MNRDYEEAKKRTPSKSINWTYNMRDWKEQIDASDINNMFKKLGISCYAYDVETGGDEYCLIFTDKKVSPAVAQKLFDDELEAMVGDEEDEG